MKYPKITKMFQGGVMLPSLKNLRGGDRPLCLPPLFPPVPRYLPAAVGAQSFTWKVKSNLLRESYSQILARRKRKRTNAYVSLFRYILRQRREYRICARIYANVGNSKFVLKVKESLARGSSTTPPAIPRVKLLFYDQKNCRCRLSRREENQQR